MSIQHPKRILVIGLTERMGGVETFIYNTTKFSDKTKYEYDYLVHGADHCVFQKGITEFYGDDSHIHFVRKIKSNPIGWLKDMLKFYRTNAKKYDYIHLQTGAASEVIYAFPFCLFYGIKVISHSHNGNGYNPFINMIFRPILNFVTCKWLACSQVAAEWLFGNKADKAVIINNGIDPERFSYSEKKRKLIRSKYGIEDEFVIGHIGRFSEQKNHEKIIEIFLEIKKKVSDAKLLLVGVGEKEESVKSIVNSLDCKEDIIFAGRQAETEAYYSAFDVFLMPSLYEGLPIVGIEAQSTGLPCFFSDQIDKQILITDSATMIALNNSAKEWAIAIVNGVDNKMSRDRYAEVIGEKGYSIKDTIKLLELIYEV